jgi:hypothetical protein
LFETHPVDVCVKTKVAVPALIAVTPPAFVTLAIDGLLLDHVPSVDGLSIVVLPMQILLEPLILTTGLGLTVMEDEALEIHPVEVCV